jgi:hypothetical protein
MRSHFEFGGLDLMRAFLDSPVTLDYGPFDGASVFFDTQPANFVPFPTATPGIPAGYVGLTNAQLWAQFGVAVAGSIAPNDATEAPGALGPVVVLPTLQVRCLSPGREKSRRA